MYLTILAKTEKEFPAPETLLYLRGGKVKSYSSFRYYEIRTKRKQYGRLEDRLSMLLPVGILWGWGFERFGGNRWLFLRFLRRRLTFPVLDYRNRHRSLLKGLTFP